MTSKELRKKLADGGYKYAPLARKIGISPQALKNRIDAQEISCSTIEMLAEAMEVSPAYFYEDHPRTSIELVTLRRKYNALKKLIATIQQGVEEIEKE